MTKHLPLAICLILCLSACSLNVKFSKYMPISSDGWDIKDTVTFATDTLRESGRYGFSCGIRTRRAYPFQDLVVMVERKVYRDSMLVLHKHEKVTCPIVTSEGNTTGEGVATKLHESKLKDFYLGTGDSIVVTITHAMTRNPLPGIVDVGVTIEKQQD